MKQNKKKKKELAGLAQSQSCKIIINTNYNSKNNVRK